MDETVTVMMSTTYDEPAVPVVVPRRIGTVRLGASLGAGTGGAVYEGYDEALRRRVAVKLIQKPLAADSGALGIGLVDGVRTAASIKHDNVITVHAVDEVNGVYVIVMELVHGVSLRAIQKCTGALDVPLALCVMRSVTAGVRALHDAQVIHRDLKPANVLFDREGRARVCDFGLACEFSRLSPVSDRDKIAGSPLYMAPETFNGTVSPQSDVYALGVMLFELLSGRAPFSAQTMTEMKLCHMSVQVPVHWLEEMPDYEALSEVIGRAMHKQRIMRYKTAAHFARALERLEMPHGGEYALRQRLATIVAEQQGAPPPPHRSEPGSSTTSMFDLVARRAQAKRRSRGS